MMGARRKKVIDVSKNTKLDSFLQQLEIKNDKREKIVKYVEQLTFDTIAKKNAPALRLRK